MLSKNVAIWISVSAAVVFAAAFMPWGEVRGTPQFSSPFGDGGPFGGLQITLTITGWNGNVSLGGLKLPNWLVVLAAGAVALVGWLRALGLGAAPAFVSFALAGYGLLHSLFALVMLMGSDRGSAGVGSLLTAIAFAGMLVLLVRHRHELASAGQTPNQTLQQTNGE